MTYKGKQYGITYYTDFMGFIYNAEMLKKAGIAAPPTTWAEVTDQAKIIKDKGLVAVPDAGIDGAGDLADRIPLGDGVLDRRRLHRRQGQCGDGRPERRRRDRAPLARRRRAQAQDSVAVLRRDRRARGPQELLGRTACLRPHPEIPAAHPQRSQAEPDRRQRDAGADAERREGLARDRRLDALLRADAARPGQRRRAPPTP